MVIKAREAVPNDALYNLRDAASLSQQEVVDALNDMARAQGSSWSCTGQTYSRWERGVVDRPEPIARRLLAQLFEVPTAELGFARPRIRRQEGPAQEDPLVLNAARQAEAPRVTNSQDTWRSTRQALNARRHALAGLAARLYAPSMRLGDTGLLMDPTWQPAGPVPLTDVDLVYRPTTAPPQLTGREAEAASHLPLASEEQRYTRYSHAIRDLVAPRLFENRLSYRLVGLDWSTGTGSMTFGDTTYFDEIDTCELLAHETAAAHIHGSGDDLQVHAQPSWSRLTWRRLIEDPFDLARRIFLPSIDTLTLRMSASGSPSMVLHQRDSSSVAVAGTLLHVMPCGVFQPSNVLPQARKADFSLWRNVMREYSEEFLGDPEHDGGGGAIDYETVEPFRSLELARRDGRLRTYCLGVALDALTLVTEILTVVVIDAEVYDDVFANMVTANSEGQVAAATAPFEEHTVQRLLTSDDFHLAPAAAGCLHLAWQHRRVVLDRS